MKMPPFLLGIALIFWGWQTEFWILAIPIAIILECPRFFSWRWDLSNNDFRRIANFCVLLLIIITVYIFITNRTIYLIYNILQWLPLIFFPLMAFQNYSVKETIDIRTMFLLLKNPTTPAVDNKFIVNLNYPYFVICIWSASVGHSENILFYIVMVLVLSIALWYIRSPRVSPLVWLSFILLAATMGFITQIALHQLHLNLENAVVAWLSQGNELQSNALQKQTNMGAVGLLKQSNDIIFRVNTESKKDFPLLLKEAIYNKYQGGIWVATKSEFTPVKPDFSGKNWALGNQLDNKSIINIAGTFPSNQGLLKLANGTFAINNLSVNSLEKNPYGTVKYTSKSNSIAYQIQFNYNYDFDIPPTADDLYIDQQEKASLEQIIKQLNLKGKSQKQILQEVNNYFQDNFSYSLQLIGKDKNLTSLSTFLLKTRSGHCEYFATATTMLLRALGIPTRYVVGYSVHEFSRLENVYIVRNRHAHAWALVYLNGKWQSFDTTPVDWRSLEDANISILAFMGDLWALLVFKLSSLSQVISIYDILKYGGLLSLVLLIIFLGKFKNKKLVRRISGKILVGKNQKAIVTENTQFDLIEKALNNSGLIRHPSESLKNWIIRIQQELTNSDLVSDLIMELLPIIELYYRDRFDPAGINATEKLQLNAAIQAWLNKYRQYH